MTAYKLTPRERVNLYSQPDTETGCWNWTATIDRAGYGRINYYKRTWYAHRFAYTHLVGPIPDGLEIDHLCKNRRCVRPSHLEPVTQLENTRRANLVGHDHPTARKTCRRGHPPSARRWNGRCKPCQALTRRQRLSR